MKSQIDLIDIHKKKQTNNLKKARNRYIATVYDDLIHKKSIKEIHADIQRIMISDNHEGLNSSMMGNYAFTLAKRMKRKTDRFEEILLPELLFKLFQKNKVYTETNSLAYNTAQKEEEKRKKKVIDGEQERAKKEGKVFYLCSEHRDCAIDHVDYQGKIYVDERWETIIKDDVLKGKIAEYVIMNNIQTFQWVIGAPVYMITRPNCRHFFKLLDNDEVLKAKSLKSLIKRNKMYYRTGRKETQTLRHSTKPEWYTKENVENIIRQYKDRLEYHKALYERKNIPLIKRAIEKDRLLIAKWTAYLQKLN